MALLGLLGGLLENCYSDLINHEKTALQRQINYTDRQIDRLVYELYRLPEEEIRIVERQLELFL